MAETIDPEGYNGWGVAWSGGKVDLSDRFGLVWL